MSDAQIDWLTSSQGSARRRRDRGMKRAAEHAEDVMPGWIDDALKHLRRYVAQRKGAPFLTEDFRHWAQTRLSLPPDGRAYGNVMRAAARAGVIKRQGFAPADSSNGSPKVQWMGA
jgi:hypothetical protein